MHLYWKSLIILDFMRMHPWRENLQTYVLLHIFSHWTKTPKYGLVSHRLTKKNHKSFLYILYVLCDYFLGKITLPQYPQKKMGEWFKTLMVLFSYFPIIFMVRVLVFHPFHPLFSGSSSFYKIIFKIINSKINFENSFKKNRGFGGYSYI